VSLEFDSRVGPGCFARCILALQVILSTGVLNGIVVVRSVDQCAVILSALLRNALELDLKKDEQNAAFHVERTNCLENLSHLRSSRDSRSV
jgi:hypothetical protein